MEVQHIIGFFIKIFRVQSVPAGDGNWQEDYKRIDSGAFSGDTYAITLRKGNEVKTRRMSLRRVGEATESKSACYMVTYDDFLVIKIPLAPLPDFETYLECIAGEKEISRKLHPAVICLIPNLSTILGKIPEINQRLSRDEMPSEEAYIRLLRKEPRFQQYLKMNGQFVFFMELSQYAFFDQVIKNIHNEKERAEEEIRKNNHAFDDPLTFEEIYGPGHENVFDGINSLIQNFERTLDNFLGRHSSRAQVATYEKREWLFDQLAGHLPGIAKNESVADKADAIRQILVRLLDGHKAVVESYLAFIGSYVRKKIFDNHRTSMAVLIGKVLEILYRLRDADVAIRDLKPDNMLVAGEREHGRFLLSDPEKYDLGLIDLETAVLCNDPDGQLSQQPSLAGTPAYMTPSHLFENPALIKVYQSGVPDIFFMQDWFATVGIIFCIVTGRRLFENTARLLPEIVRAKKRGQKRNEPEADTLATVSRIFWQSATAEFNEKMGKNSSKFRNLYLALPDYSVGLLQSAAQTAAHHLRAEIEKCAHSQTLFPKQCQKLVAAPVASLRAQRKKWEDGACEQKISEELREQMISLFEDLEKLKIRLQELDAYGRIIQAHISCDDLMRLMFGIISASLLLSHRHL